MKPSELFGVLLRIVGIWEIVAGAQFLPTLVDNFRGYNNDAEFFRQLVLIAVSWGVLRIFLGAFLFFGSAWITSKAYPEAPSPIAPLA
jgi:hypothetical protein